MKAKIHHKLILVGQAEVERTTLAVCDEDLLGKVFEEGDAILDLKTYRSFYDGESVTEAEAIELIKAAKSMNIVGKKSIAAARKAIGVSEKSVKKIGEVPHLQVYYI